MKVLVTGGTSLLGRGVARALAERGDDVRLLQRRPAGLGLPETLADVQDGAAVLRAALGCEAVVHLAARVGVVGTTAEFWAANVVGTRNVVSAARHAGASRFVLVSSPSVAHHGNPLVGAGAGPADPARARGAYSRSKAQAEVETLRDAGGSLATVAVRPHLVWGPGDTQLVGRIVARARSGRLALVDGGDALIDTTYLDNAVDALVAGLDRAGAADGRAVVVSNGEPRTVRELVERICTAAGVPAPRRRVPYPAAYGAGAVAEAVWRWRRRTDDPPMTRFLAGQLATAHWFDQREARSVLGWTPSVTLDDGFERLAASFHGAAPSH